jgi:hypothetical protein
MRDFKFFRDDYGIERVPAPVEITIRRAIITSRVRTFIQYRNDMMSCLPNSQYIYNSETSFTRDNIKYFCVRNRADSYGRLYDNYILLHDAREIEELDYIVEYLRQSGSSEMF